MHLTGWPPTLSHPSDGDGWICQQARSSLPQRRQNSRGEAATAGQGTGVQPEGEALPNVLLTHYFANFIFHSTVEHEFQGQ